MKGVVYGVIYDDDFNVVHSRIENSEDIERLAGSKYVQSCLGDTFKSVKKDLLEKRNVLFCGTPCQVAGLYSYLKYPTWILLSDFKGAIVKPPVLRKQRYLLPFK